MGTYLNSYIVVEIRKIKVILFEHNKYLLVGIYILYIIGTYMIKCNTNEEVKKMELITCNEPMKILLILYIIILLG